VLRLAGGFGAGQSVLELGAGSGVLYKSVPGPWRRDWDQLDADEVALRYCRSLGIGRSWVVADAKNLPYENASRSRVVGLTFFDSIHDEDLDPVLDEVFRVLRPGGIVLHLQDFSDWPGPDLVKYFGALLSEAGLDEAVGYDAKSRSVVFPAAGARLADVRAAIRGMAAAAEGTRRDRLHLVSKIYVDQGTPKRWHAKSLFNAFFRRTLLRHGFEVLPALSELSEVLCYTSYLAARRP
jgi:ubiquinone/menaquinone biosynthesis C-methylase UbiE